MIRLGLTGSIASGKSTVAKQIALHHFVVIDADAIAHQLLASDSKTIEKIADTFGVSVDKESGISRKELGAIVFGDETKLAQLEVILHPRIREREEAMYIIGLSKGFRGAVFDIPLLFESDVPERFDVIATTNAPDWLIEQRALARPNMTREKLSNILAKQMPQREKCRHADAIIPTGIGKRESLRHVHSLIHSLI